ncbi:MAG: GntR family transcriptional regulator [Ignavibacteriaceae bacterium]
MILKIDFNSGKPIYIQLKEQIIEGIALGLLKEGESLPSVRQLAEDIGINLHTVNKAYSILQKEGFLVIHKRQCVIVNSLSQKRDKTNLYDLNQKIRPVIAEAFCRGISENDFIEKCEEIYLLFKKGKTYEF